MTADEPACGLSPLSLLANFDWTNFISSAEYDRTTSSNHSPIAHNPTSSLETITMQQWQSIACYEAQKTDKLAQEADQMASLVKGLQGANIEEQWK